MTIFGTVGYLALGFTVLEALYQTVTTVATVGFREVHPLDPAGQVFTIVLIVVGVGTVLYNLGVILEAVTEGHLREHLERRHMDRNIAAMTGTRAHLRLRQGRALGGRLPPRHGAPGGRGRQRPRPASRGSTGSLTSAGTSPTTRCCGLPASSGPVR